MKIDPGGEKYKVFSKEPSILRDELPEVSEIAEMLRDHLATEKVCSEIGEFHKLNGNSQQIQNVLVEKLKELGFETEKRGLFKKSVVPSLRPDFYRKVGASGILVEIERGKTIANNMDLLDLWKCHLCAEADFLFLIVPNERKNHNGQVTRPFDRASKRVATFFESERDYINVEAVYLFGY
ncbi:MAG: hypothetical protein ACLPXT_03975 [Terracidiphilus sp.]